MNPAAPTTSTATRSTSPARTASGSPHPPAKESSSRALPYEERLPKGWRNVETSIVQSCYLKAEQAAKNATKETLKDLDDSVVHLIRARIEFHHCLSRVESKLQGKDKEIEALENYVAAQPRLRKRKRSSLPLEPSQPASSSS